MPRRLRCHRGGYAYHVLNRFVGRATLFHKDGDYAAFVQTLRPAQEWQPLRLLAYVVMPNHWHLVLWPEHDGDLSEFLRWLTATHPQRKKAHYHTAGTAPLYQGRFQSFPIQEDEHLFWVRRYVERNSWQGGLVPRAENWPWSSLGCRVQGGREVILEEGPRPLPGDWLALVNRPEREAELAALRRWVVRG